MKTERQCLKEQHIDEFALTDPEGNDLAYDSEEIVYQKSVKKAIREEINSHGPLVDSDEIIEEVQRLRECRRKFTRKYEHVLYTRYSNRIGELKISLEALGVPFPKAKRFRKPKLSVPKRSLYEVYRDLYIADQITPMQFCHYTRSDGGVRPSKDQKDEYQEFKTLVTAAKIRLLSN